MGPGQSAPVAIFPHPLNVPKSWEDLAKLAQRVKERCGQPPALLVVDTLYLYFGDGDENSQADMKSFASAFQRLHGPFPDLHVMVIHHMGKAAEKGMRGASGLAGVLDTTLRVTRDKAQPMGELYVEKQKDGRDDYSIPYQLVTTEVTMPDGTELTTCVVDPGPATPGPGGGAELLQQANTVVKSLSRTVQALRSLHADSLSSGGPIYFQSVVNHALRLRGAEEKEGSYDSERKNVSKALKELRVRHRAIEYDGSTAATTVITILDRFSALDLPY